MGMARGHFGFPLDLFPLRIYCIENTHFFKDESLKIVFSFTKLYILENSFSITSLVGVMFKRGKTRQGTA